MQATDSAVPALMKWAADTFQTDVHLALLQGESDQPLVFTAKSPNAQEAGGIPHVTLINPATHTVYHTRAISDEIKNSAPLGLNEYDWTLHFNDRDAAHNDFGVEVFGAVLQESSVEESEEFDSGYDASDNQSFSGDLSESSSESSTLNEAFFSLQV